MTAEYLLSVIGDLEVVRRQLSQRIAELEAQLKQLQSKEETD